MNRIAIVSPYFNEGNTVVRFISMLEESVAGLGNYHFDIVMVDDASTDDTLSLLSAYKSQNRNTRIHLISLEFNSGHQGAIYQGLLYAKTLDADRYIIMDSDGEDDPNAIPEMLKHAQHDMVHVARGKRSESIGFRTGYKLYKMMFLLVTNRNMSFGNYCMINNRIANSVIHKSFIHLAGFLSKEKGSRYSIRFDRKKRIDGKSKMNMSGLIYHAFKSLIEYAEELLMWFLKLFIVIMVLLFALLCNVIYQKFFTHTAIPGWFSTLSIGLLNLAVICIGFFVMGLLLLNISNNRRNIRTPIYYKIDQQ